MDATGYVKRQKTNIISALATLKRETTRTASLVTLSQIASSITLDLRQPLAVIATDCATGRHLLAQPHADAPKIRLLLDRILECVHWANEVVSKIDQSDPQRTPFPFDQDINEVIATSIQVVGCESISNGVKVSFSSSEPGLLVFGDRALLQQLLVTLLVVVIRKLNTSTLHPCELRIETCRRDGHVFITVAARNPRRQSIYGTGDPKVELFGTGQQLEEKACLESCDAIVAAHGGILNRIQTEPITWYSIVLPLSCRAA